MKRDRQTHQPMSNEAKVHSERGARTSPRFERSSLWAALVLAAITPAIAFFKFHLLPRTVLGWFILSLGGPVVLGGCFAGDRLLGRLGQVDALGSLESPGRRLVPATVLGVVVIAAIVAVLMWLSGNGTAAAAFRRFMTGNFKLDV